MFEESFAMFANGSFFVIAWQVLESEPHGSFIAFVQGLF